MSVVDQFRIERTDRGLSVVVVGHVHAMPRHPAPQTPVEMFPGLTVEDVVKSALLPFALVSVDHATEVITIDSRTGDRSSRFERGMFGIGSRINWYLTPADLHDGGWVTPVERYAAGSSTAVLPDAVVDAMIAAGSEGVPYEPVKFHDYSLDEESRRAKRHLCSLPPS